MQPKTEYMLKRIIEKLGPDDSARLIETLYGLIVVKRMTHQALTKKLEEKIGRPSKIHRYIKNMDAQEALRQLRQGLQEGRIGRATTSGRRNTSTSPSRTPSHRDR